ncbi:hypothetical protein BsIDN1_07850 [Bacillus safensis]|uniref:YcnI-like domain-containing protein n=1 Tax=Bacillus safensis TaxID=561879 RepID=A0A5S9M0N0_BACIA|nr:hypothetical protein BsIDN1_07850 [Bacillus safensis]
MLAGQFQQFVFVAKNPEKAGEAAWDAYQYYKDGTVVEWTGDKDADKPHSITNIVASNTVTDSHGQEKPKKKKRPLKQPLLLPHHLSLVCPLLL